MLITRVPHGRIRIVRILLHSTLLASVTRNSASISTIKEVNSSSDAMTWGTRDDRSAVLRKHAMDLGDRSRLLTVVAHHAVAIRVADQKWSMPIET